MLEQILTGWRRGTTGPLPRLTSLQVLAALVLIRDEGPVGRRLLAQALGVNDGTVRGLLERLAEQKIIRIEENGASLSKSGEKMLLSELEVLGVKSIRRLDGTLLVPGKPAVAVHLTRKYEAGMNGIKQRDEAVKAGAEGTITLAVIDGRLVMPPDNKEVRDTSRVDDAKLRELFRLGEKDLLIIGFGVDSYRAMTGALAAVLSFSSGRAG